MATRKASITRKLGKTGKVRERPALPVREFSFDLDDARAVNVQVVMKGVVVKPPIPPPLVQVTITLPVESGGKIA